MGEYANVRSKRLIKCLKHFTRISSDLELTGGGKHQYKLTYVHNGEVLPISSSHREMNRFIVKNIMEHLVKWGICTKEEFDCRIK